MKIEIKELIVSDEEIGISLSVSEDEIMVNECPTFIEPEEITEVIGVLSLAKKFKILY